MRTKRILFLAVYITFCLIFYDRLASGNDTITEVTPQGLQFRADNNISIDREYLYISLKRVEVSYIFRNHTDNDISAEIAFPIPPYWGLEVANVPFSHYPLNFDDFEVEVNGKVIDRKKEVRAYTKGKDAVDVTDILRNMYISIEDFASFGSAVPFRNNAIEKLTKGNRDKLLKLGAITPDNDPSWVVDMKYHWTQIFPANSTVSIKHRYTPYYGGGFTTGEIDAEIAKESCLEQNIKKSIEKKAIAKGELSYTRYFWVSYILTTANNWKGPIKEFHLIIEKPENSILSLCFDNKLVKINPIRFEAKIDDFAPKRDLKIYFFSVGVSHSNPLYQ